MCARMKHMPGVVLNGQPVDEAYTRGGGPRLVAFNTREDTAFRAGFLNSHARRESLKTLYTHENGWNRGTIPASTITEQGKDFPLAERGRLACVYKEVPKARTNEPQFIVNIVTRPPANAAEAQVHGRWPIQVREALDEHGNPILDEKGRPKIEYLPFIE